MITSIVIIVIAYLLGSLSSAILVCQFLKLPDPRTEGSKNPGANNVLRIGGKKAAILTLLGDLLKGFIPVFVALIMGLNDFTIGMVALAAVMGHLFPVFFNFDGGKGVATSLGVYLAFSMLAGVVALVIWAIVALISRYASLASIAAVTATPIFIGIYSSPSFVIPCVAIAALVIWKHWDNIQRLRDKTESKIDLKLG